MNVLFHLHSLRSSRKMRCYGVSGQCDSRKFWHVLTLPATTVPVSQRRGPVCVFVCVEDFPGDQPQKRQFHSSISLRT